MATKARIRRQAPPLRSSTYDQRNEEERRGAGIRKGSPSSEVRGSGVRILSVDRGRDGTRGVVLAGKMVFIWRIIVVQAVTAWADIDGKLRR